MIRSWFVALGLSLAALVSLGPANAQEIASGLSARTIEELPPGAMADLAERSLAAFEDDGSLGAQMSRAHLEAAAIRFKDAADTIERIREQLPIAPGERWLPNQIYAKARAQVAADGGTFEDAYRDVLEEQAAALDGLAAERAFFWFSANLDVARTEVNRLLANHADAAAVTLDEALDLVRNYSFHDLYASSAPLAEAAIAADRERRYIIEDVLIPTPDGARLAAWIVRPRDVEGPLPTAMTFSIYAYAFDVGSAVEGAARGYVGMAVAPRGKRTSPDEIAPYTYEVDDTTAAIDWASRQPWSDGQVGMYGGSYDGYAAWAAAKRMHPALRTIAPYVAHMPGQALPMENNVFFNANYGWWWHVTNTPFDDDEVYYDPERWSRANTDWYASGRLYREYDQVDGTPNPWHQRALQHPSFDAFWQAMAPYGEDFARIDIPVLSITGYYDDGQLSALRYLTEHYRHRPDAEHYLVIGPYDHGGAQAPFKPQVLRGYAIDPAAQFDTIALTFEWFDHVMRGGPMPEMLLDRIDYEVMGADLWRHAPSLDAMAEQSWTLYLTDEALQDGRYRLSSTPPAERGAIVQTVDFGDRTTTSAAYYPNPIVNAEPDFSKGQVFMTEPLEAPIEISGAFTAELEVVINKRDFGVVLSLQELRADGTAMRLSYYTGRASYAEDISERTLLTPGEPTRLVFDRSRVTSRRVEAGSRLVVILVIKNGFHQINYGTGGDVADDSIADASEPLVVEWRNASVVRLPVTRLAE